MTLNWASYKKRYNGYTVEIGNDFNGDLKWKPVYDFSTEYTTLDTAYYCEYPESETKGYYFRISSKSNDNSNLIAKSNVIDCICRSEKETDEDRVFVPNVFTPNGDGRNDLFMVKAANIHNFKMYIYDRWGTLIYETNRGA